MALLSACCFHTGVNQDYFSIKKSILRKGFLGFLVDEMFHVPGLGTQGAKSPTGCCAL